MLPTPANRTSPRSRSIRATASAAPRVLPQRGVGGPDDLGRARARRARGRLATASRAASAAGEAVAQPVDHHDQGPARAARPPPRRRRRPPRRPAAGSRRRPPGPGPAPVRRRRLAQSRASDRRPRPGRRIDVEASTRAGRSAPRPVARRAGGREAVGQAAADVRHARPPVQRQDFQAAGRPALPGPGGSARRRRRAWQVGRGLGDDDGHPAAARSRRSRAARPAPGGPPGLAGLGGSSTARTIGRPGGR